MIYDKVVNIYRYLGIHKNLDKAIHYIDETNLKQLDYGTYEIDGDKVILFVQDNTLLKEKTSQFEYHHRYMDIQLIDQGYERISYGQGVATETIVFDTDRDIGFYECSESVDYYLDTENFVAFFPNEFHQPNNFANQSEMVRKYVFKVKFE